MAETYNWVITCSECNISKIEIEMPETALRKTFLERAKLENPEWKFFKTVCPSCQGKQTEVELTWKYQKPIWEFVFEKQPYRITGELKNNKKKAGRILTFKITNDGEETSKNYDCSTIPEGKEMATQLIGNILRG